LSRSATIELIVRPAAAVAHAAAQFSGTSARLRYREHVDPCCFFLDLHAGDGLTPTCSFVVIAWPDRDGSRVELARSRGGFFPLLTAAIAVSLLLLPLFGLYCLALLPFHVLVIDLITEPLDPRLRDELADEVRAALDRAFAPLRRPGLPYREPAPGP
jgi:hypothetical protein